MKKLLIISALLSTLTACGKSDVEKECIKISRKNGKYDNSKVCECMADVMKKNGLEKKEDMRGLFKFIDQAGKNPFNLMMSMNGVQGKKYMGAMTDMETECSHIK